MMYLAAGPMADRNRPSISAKSTNIPNPLWQLRGIAEELFAELGGGETFIRNERAQFSASTLRGDSDDRQRDETAFTGLDSYLL
jgi:hypothetical protein